MSLRVWLPLNGTLDNQGLDDVVVTNNGATVDDSGKIGKCYNFNGRNSRISCSSHTWTYPISVCAWFKPTDVTNSNTQYWLSYNTASGGTKGHAIGIGIDGSKLSVWFGGQMRSLSTTLSNNIWYHIAFTIDANKKAITYLNGEQIDTITFTANKPDSTWFTIGARSNSSTGGVGGALYFYKGYMNDVRLYDHALSAMEVKQISQGLILHYLLNHNGFGNDNLSTGTLIEKNFHKTSDKTYFYPVDLYPLSEDARSIILNSQVGDLVTYSFDYEIENNEVENYQMRAVLKTSGSSFSTTNLQYVYSKGGILPLGNSSGHAEATFKLKQAHKTYGTGWLITAHSSNQNLKAKITHFKFEIGGKATPWCLNSTEIPTDSIFGYNDDIEYDCSGYKNNGVKEGTFAYTSNTPKYNVSSIFNGTENIKRDTLEGEIYTLTCWARTTKDKETSQIMIADSKSQMSISFYKGQIIGVFGTTRGTGSKSTLGDSYKENEWNHFAVVKTNTSGGRAIYCNGVLLTPASNDYWPSVAGFFVGTRNNRQGLPFYGEICDVRAYATALSAEDILSLYNNEAYIDNNGNIYGAVYEEG